MQCSINIALLSRTTYHMLCYTRAIIESSQPLPTEMVIDCSADRTVMRLCRIEETSSKWDDRAIRRFKCLVMWALCYQHRRGIGQSVPWSLRNRQHERRTGDEGRCLYRVCAQTTGLGGVGGATARGTRAERTRCGSWAITRMSPRV